MKHFLISKKMHFKFKNSFMCQKHLLKVGFFGFKIVKTVCISKNQEDYVRLFILKTLKLLTSKKIKICFYSNSFYSKTKLSAESRMGKGKGEIFEYFGYYKKGFILFELTELPRQFAKKLLRQLNKKKIFNLILI